jgi:PRTRC genetic system protein A
MKSLYDMLCDHWIEVPEDGFTKPINYVMTKKGCFEVRQTQIGVMTVEVDEIPSLDTELEEGIELHIPPIPGALLTTILEFFRAVYKEKNEAEAFIQVFYDREQEEYFLHCPIQQVSGAMVRFKRDPELEAKHMLVMDIHSHNSMPAFFSTIDDADEQEDRLYGVIGCVQQRIPQMEFRMGCAGRFVALDGRSLFTKPEPAKEWPREWLDRCMTSRAPRHKPQTTGKSRFPRYRRDATWGQGWNEVFTNAGEWDEEPIFRRSYTNRRWLS